MVERERSVLDHCLITLQLVSDLSDWCGPSVGSVWLVSSHRRITFRLQSDKSDVADDNGGQIPDHYQSFIRLGGSMFQYCHHQGWTDVRPLPVFHPMWGINVISL